MMRQEVLLNRNFIQQVADSTGRKPKRANHREAHRIR